MRIATWNINGLRARFDFVVHWLRSRKPDVVGLQELKVPDELFPVKELEAEGYFCALHGEKAWNGVAVLSRERSCISLKGLPGQDAQGARLIDVQVPDLSFVTLYCPNGKSLGHEDFAGKLLWLEALRSYLEDRHQPDRALVVCGDFNLCPAPLDSWNEAQLANQMFHTEEERSRFQRLLDWGLVDLYRRRFPGSRAYSWWDYRAGAFHKNQGLRIDFLLGTESVAGRTKDVCIDRDYRKKKDGLIPSDHAPVFADLE